MLNSGSSNGFQSLLLESKFAGGKERLAVSLLFSVIAAGIAGLVLYGAYYGGITALLLRSAFFSLVAAAAMLFYALRYKSVAGRGAFYLLTLLALIPGPYLWHNYIDIVTRTNLFSIYFRSPYFGL